MNAYEYSSKNATGTKYECTESKEWKSGGNPPEIQKIKITRPNKGLGDAS